MKITELFMYNKIKYLFKRIGLYVLNIINTGVYLLYPAHKKLVVNGFFNSILGNTSKNNFGDDLNFYILSAISGRKIFSAPNLIIRRKNILFIGSILQKYITRESVVWGAGVIADNFSVKTKPVIIKAVRGPLTRKWLKENNIDCPEVYADPALLLPVLYKPKVEKKYKYGIIPHYVDWDSNSVKVLCEQLDNSDIIVINMKQYQTIEILIDEINQCENIISSSLHGIIISDSYGIPNIWAEFSDKVYGNGFKFKDYLLSVNRKDDSPLRINADITNQEIALRLSNYNRPKINIIPFLKNSPIAISNSLIEEAEQYYHTKFI